ncbi:hypothetical protein V5799_006353 [Amblyomma americanum]|uniref:Ubiquitin-conjugating enzyme E2-18 kDa n=1 Tax=Amblyomma americanum TaxID=6943 RepID=A0AAQ4DWM8_AMBAM
MRLVHTTMHRLQALFNRRLPRSWPSPTCHPVVLVETDLVGEEHRKNCARCRQTTVLEDQQQRRHRLLDRSKMAATRRLQKELADIRKSGTRAFREIQVDESNILTWQGLIVPENSPYNKGAFRIEINFPAEYPFKPPKITFRTKIYHPNIDEKGQVCLPIISADNWKPATKTDQAPLPALIAEATLREAGLSWEPRSGCTDAHGRLFNGLSAVIQALIALVNDPEPEHPLRADLAEEYSKDRKKFLKNAEEFTKKHSEKRPPD